MSPRSVARLMLYVLLLSSQLWPGAAMPVRAAAGTAGGHATHAMPCHDAMEDAGAPATPPCKDRCCPHMTCDAGICATLACLPTIAGPTASSLPTHAISRWAPPTSLPRPPDAPLRPPIA